ncbi:NHLP leader peptide family RiPP precursor [Desulfovibrio inopinatus]|uniref:NHLP leader peptide family RiPP precursor n=1 Tax=Desulfovibrio inopinatus TaxID=102109 RepID=UPI00041791C1|nr:NHLP leader peptide family RiPP precursor [Desulfovibrio inopinatus]
MTAKIVTKAQQDATFKQELLNDPKSTLEKEFGMSLPSGLEIDVVEETPQKVFLVLPIIPGDIELSDEMVKKIAAGYENITGCS